jgi:uncharacterized DUF497 family protein
MDLDFEWDDEKAERNVRKHGISFQEATTVFLDPLAQTSPDPDHSATEERELTIGYSDAHRLIMVSYTHRGHTARIVSARIATRQERVDYERRGR